MNTLEEFLSEDNFLIVNRAVIKIFGLHEAILLSELLSERRYWRKENKLIDGEWFYSTRSNLEDNTGLTPTMQRSALQSLKNAGAVESKQMGLPAKTYYMIVDNKVLENLTTRDNETLQLDERNPNSINNNKEKEIINQNKKEKAPEPVPSEIKSSKRNFRRETEPLKDVLESGADIKKQVDSQKKKKTNKEKCLDEIDETKYGFTDDEKEVLREYLEWAMSGKDNRRIKNVDLWRNKLNTLIQLRDDGEDITKVVQNSLEKKWYVFVEEKQNHSNSSSHYVQKVDRIVNTKSNFNSKEEVEAELKRRVEVGIPSFK